MSDLDDIKLRREQFLGWAEEEVQKLDKLQLENGRSSDLVRYKKTLLLGILETLAKAFVSSERRGQQVSRSRFVDLVEKHCMWKDATRVSAVHLVRALDLHKIHERDDKWNEVIKKLKADFGWAFDTSFNSCEESSISDDPTFHDVEILLPNQLSCAKLNVGDKKLSLSRFKHSNILYDYRCFLIHEARGKNDSIENNQDTKPIYFAVRNCPKERDEYHLSYPCRFLMDLATNAIRKFRRENNNMQDPYAQFSHGHYLIPELDILELD